ncbi:phytoene desaturase family protein [Parasporobacterium paucivorans]|uniref:Phytoene dehydrogenase-related protein n=1 Tax=Parasporobacterium paucivorans DSM 15970 TaxID=1122934 RepID=A0A1M6GKD5_9FIRM|nr:NAD(P)/FAD-dependent oxidoreductase [Parasporobacterium paucivorans]SHJ10405.1 Phytoene dehydrogenase-related protein [Parasporobacterium paucivorans DSM 15970]
MKGNSYDVIVVGAGIAGLTSAAYLCRDGMRVLLCEREETCGGLVASFSQEGFMFDGGIRAFENSGIVFPMLKQLGIGMEVVSNPVSIGIGDFMVRLKSRESLRDYRDMLCANFPGNIQEIDAIIREIKKIMKYMDVIYGIDNPLFLDSMDDKGYLVKTLLPWLLKYKINIRKAGKLNEPVELYLKRFTKNQALTDMIIQHFFTGTPTFFALSYFGLYLDYSYPKGGTGVLVDKLKEYIEAHGGRILTGADITSIRPVDRQVLTAGGESFYYGKLVWCADMKALYNALDENQLSDMSLSRKVMEKKGQVLKGRGGNSILTVFISSGLKGAYYRETCGEHCFYTPSAAGLSSMKIPDWKEIAGDKDALFGWIKDYLRLTTYEISCPSLRDESLAPPNMTGVIVSTLFDYNLAKVIQKEGWYAEFKGLCAEYVIEVLNRSVFKGFSESLIRAICATPLTIEKNTGNAEGAITGWAFTNEILPAVNQFGDIKKAVYTPVPDIFQAGQWTFSPSGLPISILTGKLAAGAAGGGQTPGEI